MLFAFVELGGVGLLGVGLPVVGLLGVKLLEARPMGKGIHDGLRGSWASPMLAV